METFPYLDFSFLRNWITQLNDAILEAETDTTILVCVIITIVCLTAVMLIVISLFLIHVYTAYQQARIQKLEDTFGVLLTAIIFESPDDPEYEANRAELIRKHKRKYLSSRSKRQVLRKQLLTLYKNMSGQTQQTLHQLYTELNLHKDALKQLNDPDWSIKGIAVRECGTMQLTQAKQKVLRLTRHENPVLRLEAQAAMLQLDEENPFGFLDYQNNDISEWQQLHLETIVSGMNLTSIPVFSKWFNSSNPSTVQFCIKMTLLFNQFQSAAQLIEMLRNNHSTIAHEAVRALGKMEIEESLQPLIQLYPETDESLQLAIIKSLGDIAGTEAVNFLHTILYSSPYQYALQAGYALLQTGPQGKDVLQLALSSNTEHVQSIAAHMLDSRITDTL